MMTNQIDTAPAMETKRIPTMCGMCAVRCPIGCGACAQVCPHDAIRLLDEDGMRRIEITGTVVAEHPLVQCSSCGTEYATETFISHVEKKLPESLKDAPARRLCSDCARKGFAEVLKAED